MHSSSKPLGSSSGPLTGEKEWRRLSRSAALSFRGSKQMDFRLNEEQQMFKDTCAALADDALAPNAGAWDQGHEYPADAVATMAEMGLMGIAVPDSEGGTGADNLTYAITMEEISRGCASCGVIMSVNNSLYCDPVHPLRTPGSARRVVSPVRQRAKARRLCADGAWQWLGRRSDADDRRARW